MQEDGLHPRIEADRGALILPKILFFQRIRTQEPLYRSMEPGIKGKGANKGIQSVLRNSRIFYP
ncbi:hypothetical protein PRIO_4896 [Paenibacillus riograndensis SBR5]|uniref:Uncharacterized protein n=1 Tax=Paenibacillus riograndensis SBR5 TaxID=1073571 RepID=A0A0E3WIM5_9BACL|nr:hypothetical protein PRIO_4896 [Paenibacillus riograndensis SBR5]